MDSNHERILYIVFRIIRILAILTQITLFTLKVTGVIQASWWIVLLPSIVCIGLIIIAIICVGIFEVLSDYLDQ